LSPHRRAVLEASAAHCIPGYPPLNMDSVAIARGWAKGTDKSKLQSCPIRSASANSMMLSCKVDGHARSPEWAVERHKFVRNVSLSTGWFAGSMGPGEDRFAVLAAAHVAACFPSPVNAVKNGRNILSQQRILHISEAELKALRWHKSG